MGGFDTSNEIFLRLDCFQQQINASAMAMEQLILFDQHGGVVKNRLTQLNLALQTANSLNSIILN